MNCQVTMSDSGRSPTGRENFWKCNRPAVAFTALIKGKPAEGANRILLCRMHYNAKLKYATNHQSEPPKLLTA